ncbi:PDZ domain-containing protein [Microbacterium sp. NPDC058269]|uniref:PDZ domain-containing protein n=1 Tax=Microbacterium sp. NPDC058269 TaxID=3346414 RepID=UPI0036DEED32
MPRNIKKSGLTIDFVQHIRATKEEIWEKLTTEVGVNSWLKSSSVTMPSTVGERFSIGTRLYGMQSGLDWYEYDGEILEYIENQQLTLSWKIPELDVPTTVSLSVDPSYFPLGVEYERDVDLRLIHTGFPSEGRGVFEYDGFFRHWRQALGDLAAQLEGRPGKPTPYALVGLTYVGGAPGKGLLVRDVIIDSPASQAGIRPGDRILSVEGRELESLDEFHDWIDERRHGESGLFVLQDREVTVTVEGVEHALARRQLQRSGH